MATEVVMPQMGESIAEGTITKWLVKVGDKVERDQPLFEISTDKVDAEIPSPAAGVLTEILNQEGETVAVNKVVAMIGGADAPAAAAAPVAAPAPAAEPTPVPAAAVAPEAAPVAAVAATPPSAGAPATEEDRLRNFSSPLVRNIAAQEGIDISTLSGSGAHGRVTKDDILSVVEAKKSGAAAPTVPAAPAAPMAAPAAAAPVPPAQATAPAQRPTGGFSVAAYGPNDNVEIEPMSKIRQITAAHMVYSKATSAHVTTVFHVDFSKIAKLRARAKDGFFKKEATKLTFMPFIFKAVVNGLKAYKQVNASIDGTNIVYKKDINLGMAVDLGHGLIVPVIKKADQLSLVGLAKSANDLADRARTKKLKPEEASGGTFTITNPGVFGSLFGTPVINQPQVAILGVGAIEKRPIVITDQDGNDNIAIKTMCYLAITYDHRLVDGADADRFMLEIKRTIEEDTWGELEPYL